MLIKCALFLFQFNLIYDFTIFLRMFMSALDSFVATGPEFKNP